MTQTYKLASLCSLDCLMPTRDVVGIVLVWWTIVPKSYNNYLSEVVVVSSN